MISDVLKGSSPNYSRRMYHGETFPDMSETEDAENHYVIIHMPGVKKEDVKVSCKLEAFNELKIKGEGVTKDYTHVKYERAFDLPRYTTTSGIVAVMNEGELKVNIPKGEKRIEEFEVKVY